MKEREKLSQDEIKQMRRASYIKMTAMVGFVAAVIAFTSLSWFTSNKENAANGMGVRVQANGFELSVIGDPENDPNEEKHNAFYALYSKLTNIFQPSSQLLETSSDGTSIYWRMDDGDDVLMPGSEGELHFQITNYASDSTLSAIKYTLNVHGFTATTHDGIDSSGKAITIVDSIDKINENSTADEIAGADFLKEHILYFRHRVNIAGQGEEPKYKYYDYITSPTDFSLEPDEGETDEFTIYWIWPRTFGQLALDGTGNDGTYTNNALPVLYTTASQDWTAENIAADQSAITMLMTKTVGEAPLVYTFFKGEEDYSELLDDLFDKRGLTPRGDFSDEYKKISEGYNGADQCIGKNVDYALIELTATG